MAVSEEKKQKLITECRICDIDLKETFKSAAQKIAKYGSQSKPVNYGRINQIVKQEKLKGGDSFFRTWKTICVLWKSYFGTKERKDAIEEQGENGDKITKNQKFIVRPSYPIVESFEQQTVNIYQKNHDDYNNLDKQLLGLEKQFIGYDGRERRKEGRKTARWREEAVAKGLKGTEITDYVQKMKNKDQGFGETTTVGYVRNIMASCLQELMDKCNGGDAKTYLAHQKSIAAEHAAKVMRQPGPEGLRMGCRNYLNNLSKATDISKSKEILGGQESGKESENVKKLFDSIKTPSGNDLRQVLRAKLGELR